MQEKLHRAEAAAARAEERHSNESQLEARIASMESELKAWQTSAAYLGVDSCEKLAEKVAAVQGSYLDALEKLGNSEAEARKSHGEPHTRKFLEN